MKFTKMHGIGNDYVYVNCFKETVKDPSAVAKFVSDRHFGIGSDGLILIKPSDIADCEMDMYNLDGSQGAMCGNGIRCVAKYAYDYGIVNKTSISVATKSGVKYLDLSIRDGKVIDLTAKEYDLIELLMKNPRRVYSRESLMDLVWGYSYAGDYRTVDVHIRRLREKLEPVPAQPAYIMTKWGVGYYFKGESQPAD